MIRHTILLFNFLIWCCVALQAQPANTEKTVLTSGPMIGYCEMREAIIWIQTNIPAKCHIRYWPEGVVNTVEKVFGETKVEYGNTLEFRLSNLQPGTTYAYEINVGGYLAFEGVNTFSTQPLWQYRTDPPEFTLATGSCAFINEAAFDRPDKPYGGGYEIFTHMAAQKPDMMLWLGDNVYFREVDWTTRSGMIYRYTHSRSIAELQPLLKACPQYAIWDDHDFGPNDSDGSFAHKKDALDVFNLFWANPGEGADGTDDISTQFTFGDIDFFLCDNRTHRISHQVKGQEAAILGKEQCDWLIQALKYSKAPFKIVAMGGQFLNPVAKYENYANWVDERNYLLNAISDNNITGVVFLTGDRHCTELSKLDLAEQLPVYDLTVSPLTSSAYDNTNEENSLRVKGTLVPERNFATLKFSGPRKARVLTIQVFNNQGKELWQQVISAPASN
ncbi:MAG: alkaline phosphatase D family protein [Flavobacteriales bacterium]|nr:alkaline phosphatase D family protein [Flavobacteriales bacterium]